MRLRVPFFVLFFIVDLESSDELHVPAPNAFIGERAECFIVRCIHVYDGYFFSYPLATDFTICNSDEGSSLVSVNMYAWVWGRLVPSLSLSLVSGVG